MRLWKLYILQRVAYVTRSYERRDGVAHSLTS